MNTTTVYTTTVLNRKRERPVCHHCLEAMTAQERDKYTITGTAEHGSKCKICGVLAGQLSFVAPVYVQQPLF